MTVRLPSHLLVAALIRGAQDEGGSATVLARGEADGGAILVIAQHRGIPTGQFERGLGPAGEPALMAVGPQPDLLPGDDTALPDERTGPAAIARAQDMVSDYWHRRRRSDPDLWVIELDIPSAERFIAHVLINN